jgi:flagellar biosynthetic protein FliR
MLALRFLTGYFSEFIVVLMRLSGIMFTAPIFSNAQIPFRIRGFIVMVISLVAFPPIAQKGLITPPETFVELMTIGSGEVMIGATIGFLVRLVFTIFRVSGQFYSIQMGFGIINVFDPLAQTSVPIISQLKSVILSVLFLIIGGHRYLLEAIFKSYKWVPTIYDLNIRIISHEFLVHFSRVFSVGFMMGTPLIGVVFLMTVSLGILSKLAPQMNVMVIGFAVKVLVGLIVFVFLAPAFIAVAQSLFNHIFQSVYDMLRMMAAAP